MKTCLFRLHAAVLLAGLSLGLAAQAAPATNALPRFDDLIPLLRANVGTLSPEALDQALTRAVLTSLRGCVQLVAEEAPATNAAPLRKTVVYDDAFASFQVARIEPGLDRHLREAFGQVTATNTLKGLVVDLRYAQGEDYAAATAVADLFVATEQPLLNWGKGATRATAKTNAISLPVAVLVNARTSGAAEALAALFRQARVGILLGATTSGQAGIFKEFAFDNGQRIRIATAPIQVGKDLRLDAAGVQPDIEVAVNSAEEKASYHDAFHLFTLDTPPAAADKTASATSQSRTNAKPKINEAELVRMQKEGRLDATDATVKDAAPATSERPLITDPVLARALDLLKGLAIIRSQR